MNRKPRPKAAGKRPVNPSGTSLPLLSSPPKIPMTPRRRSSSYAETVDMQNSCSPLQKEDARSSFRRTESQRFMGIPTLIISEDDLLPATRPGK